MTSCREKIVTLPSLSSKDSRLGVCDGLLGVVLWIFWALAAVAEVKLSTVEGNVSSNVHGRPIIMVA
jgi:hypothetical protein